MTWAQTFGSSKRRDGRRNNGGARVGAGRPISNKYRLMLDEHFRSEIIVKEKRHGQIRYIKKTVLGAVLDSLFQQAMKGDIRAANAYFNLTLGRPAIQGKNPRYRRKTITKAIAMARIMPK